MINIPTKDIKFEVFYLKDFHKRKLVNITDKVLLEQETWTFYVDKEDFKKSTNQDIGFVIIDNDLGDGTFYKIGEDGDKADLVKANRCGFGVANCEGQDYLYESRADHDDPSCNIMAYMALRYQAIMHWQQIMFLFPETRERTKIKLGSDLYLKVVMSLGIVNDVDDDEY